MSIITLTGHLGSIGRIPNLLAKRLNYKLLDRELLIESAQMLGMNQGELEKFDERTNGLGGPLSKFLKYFIEKSAMSGIAGIDPSGLEATFTYSYAETAQGFKSDDLLYIDTMKQIMEGYAEQGNVIFVGRGGQAIFKNNKNAFNFRIVCDPEERIKRFALKANIDENEARKRIVDSDEQREIWHKKYFSIDYRSPYHYNLVMNSLLSDDEKTVDIISTYLDL
jgi:cytidylate kinase